MVGAWLSANDHYHDVNAKTHVLKAKIEEISSYTQFAVVDTAPFQNGHI